MKKYQTMFIQNKYGHKKEQFSRTEYNTNLNLNGKIIRTSDSLKILGVTIDNKLNFNEHVNDVCSKASQRVGVIMRLRNLHHRKVSTCQISYLAILNIPPCLAFL